MWNRGKKMTLQKEIAELNRDNRLITATSAIVSLKRLSALNPEYVQVGPTIGGVDILSSCEHGFFGDDATTGPIGGLVLNEEMHLRFALDQTGIYNLAIAINANPNDIMIVQPEPSPPSDGVVLLQCGGRRDAEMYEIKVQYRKPSQKAIREYVFFKAVTTPDFVIRHVSGRVVTYECRFRLLEDLSQPDGGRYFSVSDYYDSDYGELVSPNY